MYKYIIFKVKLKINKKSKLIAPNKELIPDKCKANIAKSTLGPL